MTVVVVIAAVLLSAAAVLTCYRLLAGPDVLDRVVAVDCLVATVVAGLAVRVVATGDTSLIPALVALSLAGFLGTAAVARYRGSRFRSDDPGPGAGGPHR
ncbi:monovalent cation/H+ antiporter complex subunit F [Nocardia jiangsuensis]|uniref:Monovalent cation/H+ antiporter complex subunit F n=1 Tax=Nocardia jiangsuensis TaxID=1691563 RepID=A0ABV8DPB4_9NOCA